MITELAYIHLEGLSSESLQRSRCAGWICRYTVMLEQNLRECRDIASATNFLQNLQFIVYNKALVNYDYVM